jgi:hypothetical protein
MIGIFYILAAFAVFIVVATVVSHWRMRKHPGVPRDEFIRTFTDLNVPVAISAAVHDYYKSGALFKKFGVAPDYSYEDVLHKGDEDIDDDAQILVKRLDLTLPPTRVREQWTKKIKTLRDMVLWLNWVKEHQASASDVNTLQSSPRG